MDISTVRSAAAQKATGDRWSPDEGLNADILPEVPRDGIIELGFSSSVSLKALRQHLRVMDETSGVITDNNVTVKPCIGSKPVEGEATCANVTVSGDLRIGNKYALLLPKDTDYGRASGPLRQDVKVTFGGLRRFAFPFLESSKSSFDTRFFNIYLPHGLKEGTSLSDIPIEVAEENVGPINFTLTRENKATLRLSADLVPRKTYTYSRLHLSLSDLSSSRVSVSASDKILDGFDLPLESSRIRFRSKQILRSFNIMTGNQFLDYVVFERGQDWGRHLLAITKGTGVSSSGVCSKDSNKVNIWSLKDPALGIPLFNYFRRQSISKSLGKPDDQLIAPLSDPTGELTIKNLSALLAPSGVIATEICDFNYDGAVFGETTVQAIAIGPDREGQGHELMVWVTTMDTGESVTNARVTLYGRHNSEAPFRQLGTASTNTNGIADFTDVKRLRDMAAAISIDNNFVYVPQVLLGGVVKPDIQDSIVLDRKLVRPGESLNVIGTPLLSQLMLQMDLGYVRQRSGETYIPVVGLSKPRLVVSPALGGKGGHRVQLDPEFGSYQATIDVPEDADVVQYRIRFVADRRGGAEFNGRSELFTVGLPRLPTVDLTVDTPFWIRPDGVIEIGATIESFIGSAVGEQEIDVTYTVSDPESDDDDETGELTILTNNTGIGIGTIDLSKLASKPSILSTVEIDLQYVGPTGELIEESATVDVDAANLDLDLSLTVSSPLPQLPFGASLEVTDLRGRPLPANRSIESATISLIELPDDVKKDDIPDKSTVKFDGKATSVCDFLFGTKEYCNFTLPSTGRFVVEGCVEEGNVSLCTRTAIGQKQKQWEENPLNRFFQIGFTDLTPQKLNLGDRKQILVENPYQNTKILVSWGSVLDNRREIRELPSGRSTVEVEVDQLCEHGCGMIIAVVVPRQTTGPAIDPPVPVSKLFDPARPHTEKFESEIRVKPITPTQLDVSISFPDTVKDDGVAVVGPSDNATVRVEVDANQRTEISIIAVDKAILELVPNPLADISKDFLVELQTRFRHRTMSRFIVSPNAIQALIDHFNKRKALNPWFSPVRNLGYSDDIDLSDEDYMDDVSRYLTIRSFGGGEFAFSTEGVATSARAFGFSGTSADADFADVATVGRAKMTTESSAGEQASVRSETDFETTFLFETEVTEDGKLATTFTAPVNLGTFVFRAYAVTKNGVFGSSESELIVRRELSLTPSAPVFVRVGDIFEAGAVVTVTGATDVTISLKAGVDGPLELVGEDRLDVDVGADGQEEARFRLTALAVGTGNLTLTASDGAGSADALQLQIDVEGPQEAVTVGTSFVIQGTDNQSFVEGISLPDAVPGSGGILTTAGVGRQPAVLALAGTTLRVKDPFGCPVSADFALAAVAIPGIIDRYSLWNVGDEALGEELGSLIDLMLTHFKQAAKLLKPGDDLTDDKLGLRPYLPCPNARFPTESSFSQNARGVFLMKLVLQSLKDHTVEEIRSRADSLDAARGVWTKVLGKEIERLAKRSRDRSSRALSTHTVAFGRACLGASWQPVTNETHIIDDLSMGRLSREFDQLSITSQAYYVLARQEEGDHPAISRAIDSWIDLLRVTGRTAYISASPGASAPASDLANALVFLVMTRAGTDNQLIPKLASYVANPPADEHGFRFFDTFAKVVTMQSLVEFDVSRGSATPDLQFEAISGNVTLLSATFRNASTPVASSLVPWEALPDEPEPIAVSAVGEGEASVSISLTFVPSMLLPFPTYRGIFVERSIQLEDSEDGDAKGISTVPQGEVVFIKVQFLTPDALGETEVRVLIPAGLEPVDPNVSGEDFVCPIPFFSLFSSFFVRCPIQQTRPQIVTFTFDRVSAGTTSVSFRAVAATVGTFSLPPTRVYAIDQPEVMGLSSADSFEVCSGRGCAVKFVEPSEVPKSCKDDCSGSGVCNAKEGKCICFDGFSGEACENLVEA